MVITRINYQIYIRWFDEFIKDFHYKEYFELSFVYGRIQNNLKELIKFIKKCNTD